MSFQDNQFEDSFLPVTSIGSGIGVEVTPDVYCYTNKIVNLCVIGNANETNEFILIDAGMPKSADAIKQMTDERFGKGSKPKLIILTHGHFDHVGSLVELLEEWDVPVYAHELEIPYLTGAKDYPPGDPTVDGGMVAEMSPLFPNHGIDISQRIQALPADGSVSGMNEWKWLHTPGHTPGHISLFREQDRLLIAGDAFVTVKQESLYNVLTQHQQISGPPKYFTTDWEAAFTSVKKLEALNPEMAITGHGLPMSGRELTESLHDLVENFAEIAIPKHGRYVN